MEGAVYLCGMPSILGLSIEYSNNLREKTIFGDVLFISPSALHVQKPPTGKLRMPKWSVFFCRVVQSRKFAMDKETALQLAVEENEDEVVRILNDCDAKE